MDLKLNEALASGYTSPSQRARILTEDWVARQAYCLECATPKLSQFSSGQPVADFFCSNCHEEYELKSKRNAIGPKLLDAGYCAMLNRLASDTNPNLFVLSYNSSDFFVTNFFIIPKRFFVPEIIEKRKPLAPTARRANWVGCNILLSGIPQTGKIFLVRNGRVEPRDRALATWRKTLFLRDEKDISAKGWLLDIMRCIESLGKPNFKLDEVYAFEAELRTLHPENKHIKDKIRQQLQVLRDKGYLDFMSRGHYRLA